MNRTGFDGHIQTGALLDPRETISGKIDFAGDEDWFGIYLTPYQSYLFELAPGDAEAPLNKRRSSYFITLSNDTSVMQNRS